ncbi:MULTISPECIES: HBL/NHE enterotoxin family protein [unclassified Streptomyces]|uniref:HBL/NHE enterotoxin family protein n=1 Tax=unclassified Streptomyces TaxID=2593676 RepID=UPI00035FC1A4|nr:MULTISPECIES: HBL/NHE enterotoxin family protein [unclassified Streptomyces]MYT27613.1 HBL/NHE enterotoxin family protein [Streptomyces sp. SID8354]
MTATVLSAVDQAAQNVRDGQVGDASAVPGLQEHVDAAKSHAATWLDKTRTSVREPLSLTRSLVSYYLGTAAGRLAELTPQAEAGDQAAKDEFVTHLQRVKGDLDIFQQRVTANTAEVNELNRAFTADASRFAEDLNTIAAVIATDQRMAEELRGQAQALRDKIAEARRWENVGWILGPLGYGIARIWGDNIADIDGLERRIAELERESGGKDQQAAAVSALTGRLTALSHSVSLAVNAMTTLGNSLNVTSGHMANAIASVSGTSPSYKGFVTALLDTVAANFRDLGSQLDTLLGASRERNDV